MAFGIDSAKIEKELEKVHLNEGDMIIIAHTTYYDDGKITFYYRKIKERGMLCLKKKHY